MSAQGHKGVVLMMAGGTGGHVYPALAIATELRERGYELHWVGGSTGLESSIVPAAGIPLHRLPTRGVRGKNLFHTLLGLFSLALAQLRALWIMLRLLPCCVVGLGGYASGPGGVAAWLLRRPLVIHEQNAVAGTANRMLAPLAARVLCGFEGAFDDIHGACVVGNPVRVEMLRERSDYRYDGLRPLHLLVLGGSLGARPINQVMPQVLERLSAELGQGAVQVRHQCGRTHAVSVAADYGDLPAEIMPFIDDMAEAYSWADLVVCRAGALTVAELAVMGRPAILVPLPHAIDDHQTANARALSDAGAGLLLTQSQMTDQTLTNHIKALIQRPQDLAAMASASATVARPDATRDIADVCGGLADAA